MNDLEHAKTLLNKEGTTCALVQGDLVYTSQENGVKPLLGWLKEGQDFTGFSAADKVIGRAAAFLYILLGVKEIYGELVSENAIPLLEEHHIAYEAKEVVPYIMNRKKDGLCPMENLSLQYNDAKEPLHNF